MSLTPPKNLSAVSLTPVNNFSAVSLTPAINFWLFSYFWPVSTTLGKNVTPVINCIYDRGLLLLQNYLRPPKSAMAAYIVIGTAMKTRKGTSQTLIRGPGGRQSYFKPLFSFGGLKGLWSRCVGCFWMQLFMAVPMTPSASVADFGSPSTFSFLWQLPTSMVSLFLWPAINLSLVSLSPAIIVHRCHCHRRQSYRGCRCHRRQSYCRCRCHRW